MKGFAMLLTSPSQNNAHGFSLIEAMVVVAVLSVLAAVAAPSFQPLLERWRVRQVGSDLENTLYYARSEAIKRGGGITIEKYPNTAGGCQNASTTQEWGCGWIVCHDLNNNGTCNANEPKLRELHLSGNVNVMRKPSGKSLKFDRYGMTNGNNTLSFTLLPASTGVSSNDTYTLCVAAGGRIRTLPGEIDCKTMS